MPRIYIFFQTNFQGYSIKALEIKHCEKNEIVVYHTGLSKMFVHNKLLICCSKWTSNLNIFWAKIRGCWPTWVVLFIDPCIQPYVSKHYAPRWAVSFVLKGLNQIRYAWNRYMDRANLFCSSIIWNRYMDRGNLFCSTIFHQSEVRAGGWKLIWETGDGAYLDNLPDERREIHQTEAVHDILAHGSNIIEYCASNMKLWVHIAYLPACGKWERDTADGRMEMIYQKLPHNP